ncbi:hypothetical protein [Ekhidna sp. To15]|uniref:hypothetical protein n=1 Tax=Ekhidna sp. To15 TaxID=3395267 RepID=UPI003F525E23
MKKIKIIASLLLLLALFSCQNDDVLDDMNVVDTESGKDTKEVGKALPKGPST